MFPELISIIIPTYKRPPELLKRAVDSVLSQDYANIEVIVVDDNAKLSEHRQKVITLMEKYAEDKRVAFIQNEENLGGGGSRNVGIIASKGEYIAFCDDDSCFLPSKISKQIEQIHKSKADICYCWGRGEDEYGNILWENHNTKEGNLLVETMTSCIAGTPLIMVSKNALKSVGYFDLVPCKQDVLLELKLACLGVKFTCVPETLVVCLEDRGESERISRISDKTIKGMKTVWEYARKHYDKLTRQQIRFVESDTAFKLCELTRKLKDRKAYLQYLKIGLKNAPFSKRSVKSIVKGLIW